MTLPHDQLKLHLEQFGSILQRARALRAKGSSQLIGRCLSDFAALEQKRTTLLTTLGLRLERVFCECILETLVVEPYVHCVSDIQCNVGLVFITSACDLGLVNLWEKIDWSDEPTDAADTAGVDALTCHKEFTKSVTDRQQLISSIAVSFSGWMLLERMNIVGNRL